MSPSNASSYAVLQQADYLFRIERYAEAEKLLKEWLTGNPGPNADVFAFLALIIGHQPRRSPEATHFAHQAILADPRNPEGFYALAWIQMDNERQTALETIASGLRVDPASVKLHNLKAYIHVCREDYPAALIAIEEARLLAAENLESIRLHALILLRLGRIEEARTVGEIGLRIDPQFAPLRAVMGWVALRQGENELARQHFAEALRLKPHYDFARQGLVEALKTRYPLYRPILGYMQWWNERQRLLRSAIGLVQLLIMSVLTGLLLGLARDKYPALTWLVPGVFFIGLAGVVPTIASAFFDILLYFDLYARLSLSTQQIYSVRLILACSAIIILTTLIHLLLGQNAAGLTCLSSVILTYIVLIIAEKRAERKQSR